MATENGPDVTEYAKANALSVTRADAWAMLALTPARSTPSVWARALIVVVGDVEVASRLGVSRSVVQLWRNASSVQVVGGLLL